MRKGHKPVPLNCGILIIGSLLWDDRRQAWREERLLSDSAETVTAPIRYGRLSGKQRGHTYTMVFSRGCKIGHAMALRCSHSISSIQDLIAEAEHLWKAEQPAADAGRIAAQWGCVALLQNPDRKIPGELLKGWAERVAREADYGNVQQEGDEGCLVSNEGLLRIPWPRLAETGKAADFDILLATANDPTIEGSPPSYPDVAVIAAAWNRAGDTHAAYFWRNIEAGIRTFQDREIQKLLRPRGPGSL